MEKEKTLAKAMEKETTEVVKDAKSLKQEISVLRNLELQNAFNEIQAICNKYECGIVAEPSIEKGAIVANVKLVDLQK